ncbi:unnamed protein product [Clavelina lepadiformis]|uniref:Uncharacterized protein n=1 Tax=Clavelina lepadiformis TaxID=159417 RepID=A0ABP0FSU1_CLALP
MVADVYVISGFHKVPLAGKEAGKHFEYHGEMTLECKGRGPSKSHFSRITYGSMISIPRCRAGFEHTRAEHNRFQLSDTTIHEEGESSECFRPEDRASSIHDVEFPNFEVVSPEYEDATGVMLTLT